MDDFRVLSTSGSTPPVGLRITPAISPIFGNDPAFSVLDYSVSTGAVSDIATYYLDLMKGATIRNGLWSTASLLLMDTTPSQRGTSRHSQPPSTVTRTFGRFSPVTILLQLL